MHPLEKSTPQIPRSSSINLFAALPDELVAKMLPRLEVHILKRPPTKRQKDQVVAFNVYHLIVDNAASKKYLIGFCKEDFFSKEIGYVTQSLNQKGSLFRLIEENSELFNNGMSQDRLVIVCLEREIEEAGGLVRPIGHALHQCRVLRARKGPCVHDAILEEERDKLLHHVAYGEQAKVEKILKWCPELLWSTHKGSVTDCSRVRTFLNTSAFQLAVRNGDWHMYRMMLKLIPNDRRPEFKANLRQQLQELEEQGLEYELDNLNWCGLRVLGADPSEESKNDVIARNAYHLILEREKDAQGRIIRCGRIQRYFIGFRNAQGEYERSELSGTSALKQWVLQSESNNSPLFRRKDNYPHLVMRDPSVLKLAREEIEAMGGLTKERKNTSLEEDLQLLQAELTSYIAKYSNAPTGELMKTWCVLVGWAQRLLPANVWQWWMHPDTDWFHMSRSIFRGVRPRWPVTFYENVSWLPLSPFFGNDFAAGGQPGQFESMRVCGTGGSGVVQGCTEFVEFFSSSSQRKLSNFKHQLAERNLAPRP